jgi:hypothetical protein
MKMMKKKLLEGVGAEHLMLTSAATICECEHSHLYASLFSARPYCRATPFKREKCSTLVEQKKACGRKAVQTRFIACARNQGGNLMRKWS